MDGVSWTACKHVAVRDLETDEHGLAKRGLLVRHLVMPNGLAGSASIAEWLAQAILTATYVNVMNQYHLDGEVVADAFRDICRGITAAEFRIAFAQYRQAGLTRFDQRRIR